MFKRKKLKLSQKIILILNVALLSVNSILVFKIIHDRFHMKNIHIQSTDLFNINLFKNTYKYISNYLANKYYSNNKEVTNLKTSRKKLIKIKSVGLFNHGKHIKWLRNKLDDDEFILSIDDPNPDYLIYNSFNEQDKNPKYANAIRIAFFTENIFPDLNYADYIIGHYHINYLDRYFKYSLFLWQNFREIVKKRNEVIINPNRTKFCAAVISNCKSSFRMNFIRELNKYKKVDLEGKCKNRRRRKTIGNKIEFLTNYKFSIAMENSKGDGYISEKIIDSFNAGTIPIYYGDYMLDEFINPKTYILIKGKNDISEKIEYIKKIDNDKQLYLSIMKENPIIDHKFVNTIDRIEIKSFLKNIFNQDKDKAFRRDNNYYSYHC